VSRAYRSRSRRLLGSLVQGLIALDAKARFAELDMVAMGTTSAQAVETLKADIARLDPVVRRLGLQLE